MRAVPYPRFLAPCPQIPTDVAGITHMAIDSMGNVGLGTQTMDAKLHLYDAGSAEIIIEADVNDGFGEEEENPTIIFRQDANINNGLIGLNGSLDSSYTGSIQNAFYMEAQGNTGLNDIQFVTGATGVGAGDGIARMTITEVGNVGIGLLTPSTLLHVGGDARIGEVTDDDGGVAGEGSRLYFSGGDDWSTWNSENSDAIYLVRYNAANDNTQLRFNVGDNSQSNDKFEFGYTNAGIWNPQVVFETGGNVGIGTTAPIAKLDVTGDLKIASMYQQSLTDTGYIQIGGLIIQWGKLVSISLNQTFHSVTFPVAFSNSVFNVQATIHRNGTISGTVSTVVRSLSTTGCEIAGDHDTNTSTGDIYWMAIGN